MFVYQVLFWLGTVGFGMMVAMGFLHGGHHGDGNAHGHGHGHLDLGHENGHGHAGHSTPLPHHGNIGHADISTHGAHAPSTAGHQQSPLTGPKVSGGLVRLSRFGKFKSIFAISPIDIFSLALGGGATGILARHSIDPALLPYVAALGAVVLNYGIVRPMFMLAMKFVGVPSEGLQGAVARTGEAITRFDAQGKGLIHLVLDGEDKQLLANLDESDRELGIQIGKGDRLLVLEVDAQRNTCRVTRV